MEKMNEKGRSMVEMLGVLAIIGVLSAGGLAGYSKAMFKHKLNSTIDQITMLVTNIRTMYGTQGNYTGLDGEAAYDLGIIPAVMTNDEGATLTNPFKGGVSIALIDATDSTATSGNTGFTLTYSGLPAEACIALATSDFGSGAGSGFIGVKANNSKNTALQIGGTGSKIGGEAGTSTYGEGQALQMSDAVTACQGNENSTVTWYFY